MISKHSSANAFVGVLVVRCTVCVSASVPTVPSLYRRCRPRSHCSRLCEHSIYNLNLSKMEEDELEEFERQKLLH